MVAVELLPTRIERIGNCKLEHGTYQRLYFHSSRFHVRNLGPGFHLFNVHGQWLEGTVHVGGCLGRGRPSLVSLKTNSEPCVPLSSCYNSSYTVVVRSVSFQTQPGPEEYQEREGVWTEERVPAGERPPWLPLSEQGTRPGRHRRPPPSQQGSRPGKQPWLQLAHTVDHGVGKMRGRE